MTSRQDTLNAPLTVIDLKRVFSLGAVLIYLVLLWWSGPMLARASLAANAWVALIGAVIVATCLVIGAPRRWLSVPAIYFFVFAVFHIGLAPLFAFGLPIPDFGSPFAAQWVRDRPVGTALYVVSVAMACFAVGVRVGGMVGGNSRPAIPVDEDPAKRRVATVALAISAVGVCGWFAFVLSRAGVEIFVGSYSDYIKATGGGALPQIYLLIALGASLCAIATSHSRSRLAFVFLGAFAVFALLLGLRAEVMFPAAAALAVLAKRGEVRLRLGRWLLIAIVLLSCIAGVRSIRSTGLGDVRGGIDVNPVHGLAELGYSLRPVAEVLEFQTGFEEPVGGRTYIRPFERALARLLPSVTVPPAQDDPYIMNVVISDRVGPIGFSPSRRA